MSDQVDPIVRQHSASDLLDNRMAMLGLDRQAIASCEGEALARIERRCELCDVRQACSVDLSRDPNNPVWESYCPNAAVLVALTEGWWLTG